MAPNTPFWNFSITFPVARAIFSSNQNLHRINYSHFTYFFLFIFQVQIYNQYGQFVRKFGANILQHPRGVTVDNKGRIIVVECKVMRVIIFDQAGNVLNKFGCSKHLEFPNGVVVNDRQEIFISDNRAHCVKVFNYEGVYLRQIGGEGNNNFAKVFYFWGCFFHVFIGEKSTKLEFLHFGTSAPKSERKMFNYEGVYR